MPKPRSARSEILEILRSSIPTGDFTIAEVVEKARVDISDDLFQQWAEEEVRRFLAQELSEYILDQRARTRSAIRRGGHVAVKDDGSGKLSVESIYEQPFVVNGVHRPLGDLTGKDLRWVAQDYEKKGNELLFWAGVYTKLARRVGKKTVREVIDADNLKALIGL